MKRVHDLGRRLLVALKLDPASGALVACAALLAAIALRFELLVGHGLAVGRPFGAVLLALLIGFALAWAVAAATGMLVSISPEADRRVVRRTAVVPLLATIALVLPALVDRELPYAAGKTFAKLLPLVLAPALWAALLPGEARQLGRLLRKGRFFHWLPIGLAAVIVVAIVETVFVGVGFGDFRYHGSPLLLALNVAFVASVMALAFAITGRLAFSIGLAALASFVMAASSIAKLHTLHTPATLADIGQLGDLWEIYAERRHAPLIGAALVVLGFVGWAGLRVFRDRRASTNFGARALTGAIAFSTIALIGHGPFLDATQPFFYKAGVKQHGRGARGSSRKLGLLLESALVGNRIFIAAPEGYSRAAVEAAWARYPEPDAQPQGTERPPIDLVILMVESLWDPVERGVRFTRDPIPNYRAMARRFGGGRAISPVFGGLSANAEFEFLSGLSVLNLPSREAIAFVTYVERDLPSLPRELARNGYRTVAFSVLGRSFQGTAQGYRRLGFDEFITLGEIAGLEKDVADRTASDAELVEAMIREGAKGGPCFLFGFANGTHWPWDYPGYEDSDLDVASPMSEVEAGELRTYANALADADAAIGRLVDYVDAAARPTLLLVVGDHLPLFTREHAAYRASAEDDLDEFVHRYGALYATWSNFERPQSGRTRSLNLFAPWLLHEVGIAPSGFLAVSDRMREDYPVISHYVERRDGVRFERATRDEPVQRLLRDYALLQYDVLFGEQYALEQAR